MQLRMQDGKLRASPQLAPIPKKSFARLLDKGLLHYEASLSGFAERYGRGETTHTIHVWWARRPHVAMRTLVFASLSQDKSQNALDILASINNHKRIASPVLKKAREFILSQYDQSPRALDMFAGGGTIPFEFAQFGADTYSIDANQLSAFIQKCNLQYSQKVDVKEIQSILLASGQRVLNKLVELSEPLFPLRRKFLDTKRGQSPLTYIWSYSTNCENCNYRFYLSKRPWLSRKKQRNLGVSFLNKKRGQAHEIIEVSKGGNITRNWTSRNGKPICPKCQHVYKSIDVSAAKDELIAIVYPSNGLGKEFTPPKKGAVPDPAVIEKIETEALREIGAELPRSELPRWSGIVNPALYGIKTHSDFLNRRQRVVLLLLIKALREEWQRFCEEGLHNEGRYVVSLLSALIDQLVDWNCRLSMWIPQNEQVGRAFCGPGVSMLWDYAEIDPAASGPANLWDKLKRISAGASYIGKFERIPKVLHGYAQNLPFKENFFDIIITDPPYYDNIYYNVLADFFYSWKRLLLRDIEPELFEGETTDFSCELVASAIRNGSPEVAHEKYCVELGKAIQEAERVLEENGVFCFVYSHASLKGWEALIRAFRPTKLVITSVQPLSIERKARPRAFRSEAVNTCIAFVMRKGKSTKNMLSSKDLCKEVHGVRKSFGNALLEAGWHKADVALAVFAHGVAMLTNIGSLSDLDSDIAALQMIESVVREDFPSFRVKDRKSL